MIPSLLDACRRVRCSSTFPVGWGFFFARRRFGFGFALGRLKIEERQGRAICYPQ